MTAPSGEPGLDPTTPPAPPTPPAPGVPAPAPQPTAPTGQDPSAPIDFDNLPPNVKAYVKQLRDEAAGNRQGKTAAEQGKTAAEQGKTAAEQRAQEAQELADAQAEKVWGSSVKLQIFERAAELGADPKALLADDKFVDSLDDLADDDPTTAKFGDALEARIAKAVKADPKLAAQRGGPARQGVDISGGTGGRGRSNSLEQALTRRLGG